MNKNKVKIVPDMTMIAKQKFIKMMHEICVSSPNASGTITTVRDKDSPIIIDSTVKSEKYGSCIPVGVGVGVALGEVLLDSITVYSGTTTA